MQTSRSTFVAFDYGSQCIGVAAGSPAAGLPTPLTVIRVFRSGPDWIHIDRLVREWQPEGLIVGLALNSLGEDTSISRKAREFGRRAGERYDLPVHWVDETLSTEAARRTLREAGQEGRPDKQDIDNTAAALILESFLETHT